MRRMTVCAAFAAALSLPAAGQAACYDDVLAFVHDDAYAAGLEAATPLAQRVARRHVAIASEFARTEREDACYTMLTTARRVLQENALAETIGGWDMEGGLPEISDAAVSQALADLNSPAGAMGTVDLPENAPAQTEYDGGSGGGQGLIDDGQDAAVQDTTM